MELASMSPAELLALHARVAEELRARGVTRTSNPPAGDLAECLFCRAFGWKRTDNSNKGVDAIGADGLRYQIKGRRMRLTSASRQLSAIRNLDGEHFDFIAGVLFFADYRVMRAAIIPRAIAVERARFDGHTNSHILFLRDDVWNSPNVRDVTAELCAVTL